MGSIRVHCSTNLDGYQHEKWPDKMIVRPLIGDRVKAASGNILKIVGITHYTWEGEDEVLPMLEVELSKLSL